MTVRVLHVFGTMKRGGAELRTLAMLDQLSSDVVSDFVVLSGNDGPLDDQVRAHGGQVYKCALGPSFPARFLQLLRRVRPDVLHSHVHWVSGLLVALARAARVPGRICHFRSTGHNVPTSRRRQARDRLLRHLVDRHATEILSVGDGVLDTVWGPRWREDPRCQTLYAGVDLTPFSAPRQAEQVRQELGLEPTATLLMHVGNLRLPKNHPRIARIFARIHALDPSVHLVLAGQRNPDVEQAMAPHLAHAQQAGRVHLLGARSDVPRLLSAGDAFLFPSLYEGLPGSVLEALAGGLRVVGSDLPGVQEIARQIGGVVVLSHDDDDDTWAAACLEALRAGRLPAGALEGTPFDASASAKAHEAVWRRYDTG